MFFSQTKESQVDGRTVTDLGRDVGCLAVWGEEGRIGAAYSMSNAHDRGEEGDFNSNHYEVRGDRFLG